MEKEKTELEKRIEQTDADNKKIQDSSDQHLKNVDDLNKKSIQLEKEVKDRQKETDDINENATKPPDKE